MYPFVFSQSFLLYNYCENTITQSYYYLELSFIAFFFTLFFLFKIGLPFLHSTP